MPRVAGTGQVGRPRGIPRIQRIEGMPGNRGRAHATAPAPRKTRPIDVPPAPMYLDADARRAWNETAPGLAERGMLTEADVHAFAAYCAAVSDWIAARKAVQRLKKRTMKMPGGSRQQAAEVGIANRAEEIMFRRGEQFGLNGKLNRDRMGVGTVDDGDDRDGLLSRGSASG